MHKQLEMYPYEIDQHKVLLNHHVYDYHQTIFEYLLLSNLVMLIIYFLLSYLSWKKKGTRKKKRNIEKEKKTKQTNTRA